LKSVLSSGHRIAFGKNKDLEVYLKSVLSILEISVNMRKGNCNISNSGKGSGRLNGGGNGHNSGNGHCSGNGQWPKASVRVNRAFGKKDFEVYLKSVSNIEISGNDHSCKFWSLCKPLQCS
jgi:hypothetical protein